MQSKLQPGGEACVQLHTNHIHGTGCAGASRCAKHAEATHSTTSTTSALIDGVCPTG